MGAPWRVLEEWKEQSPLNVRRECWEVRWEVRGPAGRALEAVLRRLGDKSDLLDLHLKLIGFLFCGGMDCRRAGNKDLANFYSTDIPGLGTEDAGRNERTLVRKGDWYRVQGVHFNWDSYPRKPKQEAKKPGGMSQAVQRCPFWQQRRRGKGAHLGSECLSGCLRLSFWSWGPIDWPMPNYEVPGKGADLRSETNSHFRPLLFSPSMWRRWFCNSTQGTCPHSLHQLHRIPLGAYTSFI